MLEVTVSSMGEYVVKPEERKGKAGGNLYLQKRKALSLE